MGAREACGSVNRRAGVAAAVVAALLVAGCGGDEDFANDPRPAAADRRHRQGRLRASVVVSPKSFGAGLVNITVSNQSDDPVTLTLVGPTPDDNFESGEIPPERRRQPQGRRRRGRLRGQRRRALRRQARAGRGRARRATSSSDELLLP